ncbi:NADH-ubiquinone oxidoreductase 12 kda subunit [Penicillium frequentans]|uniref:NADH-ubiquinone oxidoreductase 12 kDa subunit n=1 Tax=Penicillium frequentans TaxID=3151616 RepID=A0AAD6GJG4_9EURO|nr:NADH-ubiquinone oxidoreductase 12 kda subunit [Penicillium glabrum]
MQSRDIGKNCTSCPLALPSSSPTALISPNHSPPNPTSRDIGFDGINLAQPPKSPHPTPTVAPTYEGVDFEDNVAVHNARDAIIREQWVRSMMSRLVGEELGKCYAREGVNHLEKCGVLREKYFELLGERKIKGYLFQEKNALGEKA